MSVAEGRLEVPVVVAAVDTDNIYSIINMDEKVWSRDGSGLFYIKDVLSDIFNFE